MNISNLGKDDIFLPLKVGQSFSRKICFDAESVRQFATLVGDPNPLHHDQEAAKKTRFGGLIASGTQISSVMGAMIASKLCSLRPSLGLEMSFCFRRPVHIDVEMVANWEITAIESNSRLKGNVVTFSGELRLADGTLLVSGTVISLVN